GGSMTMHQDIYTTYRVLEAAGDTYTVSTVIDSVRIDAAGMPGTAEAERMMEGVSSRTRMTTRGEILNVDLDDETFGPAMQQGIAGMGEFMGGFSLDLPEQPVRRGATWTVPTERTMEVENVGQMRQLMELTYRLERIETRAGSRHAILSCSGTLTQDLVGDTAETAMSLSYTGDMSGEMDLDLDAGRFDWFTMETTIHGSTQVGGQKTNMTITMSMEQRIVEGGRK
ncbi:MAG: hypothetical protein PVF27_09270, partial [Gemmatimonadales bacterium]